MSMIIRPNGGSSGGGVTSSRIKFIEDAEDNSINGNFSGNPWEYDEDSKCWINTSTLFEGLNFEINNVTRLVSILVDLYAIGDSREVQIKMFSDSSRTNLIGRLAFQGDGNIVLYSGTGAVLGASGTGKYNNGDSFRGIMTLDITSGEISASAVGAATVGFHGNAGVTMPSSPATIYYSIEMVQSAITLIVGGYSPNMDIM